MPLHIFFCVAWFLLQEEKGFQKPFENDFDILEKKKKMEIFSLLSFRPEGPAFSPPSLGLPLLPIPKPSKPAAPLSLRAV
jgi:hypothetical protein